TTCGAPGHAPSDRRAPSCPRATTLSTGDDMTHPICWCHGAWHDSGHQEPQRDPRNVGPGRAAFELPWSRGHAVRTLLMAASFAACLVALAEVPSGSTG